MLLSVFSPIAHNPAPQALARSLAQRLGPAAADIKQMEHALGDATELLQVVVVAGFGDVTLATVTQEVRFASPRDYVRLQLTATPLATLVRALPDRQQASLVAVVATDVAAALPGYVRGGQLIFPQECHLVAARPLVANP
jgi:hypothetical protein